MAEQAPRTRQQLEARLFERAAKDAAFRRALIEDPKGTLERELGRELPAGVKVQVVEETPTTLYLVVPPKPPRAGELSDQELDRVAGGEFWEDFASFFVCTQWGNPGC